MTNRTSKNLCQRCGVNPVESTHNRAKYCNECREADKHRHAGRIFSNLPELTAEEIENFTVTVVPCPPCQQCGGKIDNGNPHALYCNACRKADPHYHRGRKSRALPEMIVHVDTEGDGKGNILCASYGREDGSSDTIHTSDPVKIIHWWIDNLTGTYNGYRQIIGAFHFNYDAAVLTRFMDEKIGRLRLIHKARTKPDDQLICNRAIMAGLKHNQKRCPKKFHAFDSKQTAKILTTGGEENVITYDPETSLAIAATPKRRYYVEYRPKGWDYNGYRALDIHDMGMAFIGGLEQVIDTWQPELSPAQRDIIRWGKQARKDGDGKFDGGTPEQIAAYSEAECIAAARCARLLIDTISEAVGVKIRADKLYGSGSLATAAFREHKFPTNSQTVRNDEIDDIAQLTYFGGLIETPVIGIIRRLVFEEDLNSAYPARMVTMPCMRDGHGGWKWINRGFKNPSVYGITENTIGHVLMKTWYVDTLSTPPFMVRDKTGCVYQPLRGNSIWVTMSEYVAAVKQFGLASIQAEKAVFWEQTCNCPSPLAWLAELYDKRLAIKEQMKGHVRGSSEWQRLNCHQEAIKLVINSCYGKLAQRRPVIGPYTNLHYASHITGGTRAMVRERTWKREKGGSIVIYQHTDSVLTVGKKPPAREVGTQLGQWGLEDKQTIDPFILQPGLMTGLTDGKTATRGVGKSDFKICAEYYANNYDLTRHPTEWETLKVPTRRMISRKMAQFRNKPELAGLFVDDEIELQPSRYKRDLESAYPVPGQPEAWFVPPIEYVDDPVTSLSDIEKLQKEVAQYDNEDIEKLDVGVFNIPENTWVTVWENGKRTGTTNGQGK